MNVLQFAINRALAMSGRRGEIIRVVEDCSDGELYNINFSTFDQEYLEAEVLADCYPDGKAYVYVKHTNLQVN